MNEMKRSKSVLVDVVDVERWKAHNLALVERTRLGFFFLTLCLKLFTPYNSIIHGSTTLLLPHPSPIDQIPISGSTPTVLLFQAVSY